MSDIELHSDLARISPEDLHGFFVGWSDRPTPGTHRRLLAGSTHFVVAVPAGETRVIGYATALSDGVLSAYLAHLEVLPEFRGRGIGTRLVEAVLERVGPIYMVDVTCDEEVQPFYERLGHRPWTAMIRRNYRSQAGLPPPSAGVEPGP